MAKSADFCAMCCPVVILYEPVVKEVRAKMEIQILCKKLLSKGDDM